MMLKAFDIFDMLDGIDKEKAFEIMNEVQEFCLYTPEKNGMGICLIEQKENILSVIQKHAIELNLKVRVQGNFINLSTTLMGENVDWNDIWVGDTRINCKDFWKEVVSLVSTCEERLIEADNFAVEWHCIKKEALKNVIDKIHEQSKKELEKSYANLVSSWSNMKEVPLF
ncbi:hypothetical protein ACFVS2_20790 [Brevibacillus sp. NPDC058079]|uniref:hypothetical protein n=1 Tax=Brevibacillus sp. NPDC058079 TaxID=3346330 RepID=UPI0036EE2B88